MKKTVQANIAMNDSYDTILRYNNSLVSYRPFTAMLVWNAFFNFTKMFVCYYRYICISNDKQCSRYRIE